MKDLCLEQRRSMKLPKVCVCERERECVCVREREKERGCVRVCVCVCSRERARKQYWLVRVLGSLGFQCIPSRSHSL